MRCLSSSLVIILTMAPSAGLAQESLCNPCVDPPAYRSPLPEFSPLLDAEDVRALGLDSNLGLNNAFGMRTLTLLDSRRMRSPVAPPVEGEEAADGSTADPADTVADESEESNESEADEIETITESDEASDEPGDPN